MDMSTPTPPAANVPLTSILLVCGDDALPEEVSTILTASPKIKLQEMDGSAVGAELNPDTADLIIVNVQRLGDGETELVNSVLGHAGSTPVILVSPQLQSEEIRRLFKFGVHDWLPKPLNPGDLFDSIIRDARSRKASSNRVHAVISAVGGAGASTIALALADAATRMARKRHTVALFDLDFSLGNAGVYANLQNDFKLGSIASAPRRVDAEFIRAIQKQHKRGFYLYSFQQPELNGELNGYELVLRLLDAVSFEHEQVFLDIPYYATEWREDVLTAVNTCTIVSELNLAAIRHTIDTVEAVQKLRGRDFPVRVVFNKYESSLFGQRVGRKQIKELFGDVPFDYFPNDARTIGESIDRGMLPAEVRRRSKLVKAATAYLKKYALLEETAT